MTKEVTFALRAYTLCHRAGDSKASQLAELVVHEVMGRPSQLRYATPKQLVPIEHAKSCLRATSQR